MATRKSCAGGAFTRTLIRFSFFLAESPRYRSVKDWFRELLEDLHSQRKRRIDLIMIVLVIASVALLVYSVKNPLRPPLDWFEEAAVTVFIIEYLLRAWVYSDVHRVVVDHYERAEFLDTRFRPWPALKEALWAKWRYATSPLAIIDLLAILPSYRPIRLLRVFLLFRLFKLFRYANSMTIVAETLAEKRFEFYMLALFAGFMVITGASAIYLFEADLDSSRVNTYFDALYWSVVTLSTVGYGDITPVTPEGQLVAMVIIVSGIAVLAFTTSIVVSAFQEKLGPMRDYRVFADLERIHGYTVVCGYGRVGQVVVERLAQVREHFVILEQNPEKVRLAVADGYRVVQGDAASAQLMERVGLGERAGTVVCVTGDDVANVFITISARSMNPELTIIARANNKDVVRKLELAGANHVVAPFQVVGLVGAEYVGRPVAFEAFRGIIGGGSHVVLDGIRISPESQAVDQPLARFKLDDRKLVVFGVIRQAAGAGTDDAQEKNVYPLSRGRFHYNPPGDFVIRAHDLLVVFGHEYSIARFNRLLETVGLDL
ncbi:MAG: NAD-binding protein [Pseudomonadota bacterium]|nr:NAD-binding protein [Pseudomonadota bacterium]